MPTLQQLPQATTLNPTDQVLLQQPGKTTVVTVANLLATTQPKLTLAAGALLGRASALPGTPEPVGLGPGLVMQSGTLAADTGIVARLASPAFSGTPTAPTPGLGDNSTAIATTAFVQSHTGPISVVGDVVGAGSGTLSLSLPPIATPGTFAKVTVNAKGQVVSGTSLAASDVSAALGFAPYPASNPAGYVTSSAVPAAGAGLVANSGTLSVALAGLDGSALTVAAPGGTRSLAAMAADTSTYARAAALAPVATSGSYADLTAKPALATVASSGSYADLTAKPALATVASSGSYADLTAKPALATVATSGSYADLANKPALGTLAAANSLAGLDASAATSKPVAAGAVARTHAARAADWVNLLDFGADPTGVADSFAAFTAALAVTTGTMSLFVPRGTYRLSANVIEVSGRLSIELDDGVKFTGGILYVSRTEQRRGNVRTVSAQGVADPASTAIAENLYVTNNGGAAGVGWLYHYDNWNTASTNNNGGDIALNTFATWHQIAGTEGFGQWHVVLSPFGDAASATAGNNWAVKVAEYNIGNYGADWGWTDAPGSQPTMARGCEVVCDPWGPTGNLGTHSLYAWAALGGNLNNRWTSYPAVFGSTTPTNVATTDSVTINGTTVVLSVGSGTAANVATAINAAGIANVAASVDIFGRPVVYSTLANNTGTLTLANGTGTPLQKLGWSAGTYTAPRGPSTIVRGAQNPPRVLLTDVLVVNGTNVALNRGTGTLVDVAAAINSSGLTVTAAIGAYGELVLTDSATRPITLANGTGTPLATLSLPAGTTQPPYASVSPTGAQQTGHYNGFLVGQNAIAPGGRGFYAGGNSTATAALLPYAPLEARYNWAHGLRLEQAALADSTALAVAASHSISWGTGAASARLAATPTVAALRAIPAAGLVDGASMVLLAYATRGDGGGGNFTWNAASTAADNSGTVVNPTGNAGAGRWLRQLADGRLTPQMFGAKGDGSTDDTAAFNAALAAGPVVVPNAKYVVGNVIVPNGAWMEGGAGLGYSGDIGSGTPTANQKAAVVSPILLAKSGTTSCILNVNGCNDATLKGLFLDGITTSCDGVSPGSTQLMMERVTVVRCVNGLGATSTAGYTGLSDLYTHVATLINCQFSNCTNGIANPIDSAMLGGACSANTVGVNLGSGANANTFAGCRFEWCYQDGVAGYNCASNVFIGGLFDRNAWRAVNLGTGCNDFTFTGVQFARNGSNNTYPNNAHIALNGTTSVFFNGCVSRTGKNDDGTGTLSPAYFVDYINTNALVTISGCDVSGYTAGFSFGPVPTSYVQRDNFGAGDTFANAARPYISGGAVRQTLFTKAAANVAPGATTTIAMGQSPITTNYSATARELVVTAVNFNSPYQTLSASFRLVFYRDTAVHLPSASAVFAEAGGAGLITFGTTSSLQLSTSGIAADGSSFTLGIKNGASSDRSNWGVWAELQ